MELVVAAALFATSFLVLVGAFPLSAKAVRRAQYRNIATHLAQNRLERLKASAYLDIVSAGSDTVYVDVTSNGSVESVRFDIEQNSQEVTPGLKRVRATVRWFRDGQNHRLELESDVAKLVP